MTTKKKESPKDIGSAFDLLGKSAAIVKKHWQLFALVNLFPIVWTLVQLGDQQKTTQRDEMPEWVNNLQNITSSELAGIFLGLLVFAAIGLFFYTMSVALAVKAVKGEVEDFSDLVADGKTYFFPLFLQLLATTSIVVIGLILFIIPGIIAIKRLMMAPYILVNEKLSAMDSLKRSNELAKQYSSEVWAVFGVNVLVAIAGVGLGLIPILGSIAALVLGIAWSLITPLRYMQIKNL